MAGDGREGATRHEKGLAREQGWQHGQYWALEVDAEAKQKLLEAEEAKRAREEAERAKEEAEKQAFIQRQMELLERAGRAPRCEYKYTDGRGCKAPQVKGERWCHGHAKMMSYRPEKLEILPMEDEQAVMVNLYRVTNSLLAGRISEKTAALLLWSAAMVSPCLNRRRYDRDRKGKSKTYHGGAEARRKIKKNSPEMQIKTLPLIHGRPGQVNTENKSLQHPAIGIQPRNQIAGAEKANPKSVEAQRNEVSRGNAVHSGVTNGKSFVSGVTLGSTPVCTRDRRHRATSEKENHKGRGASGHRDIGTAGQRKPRIHRKGRQGRNGSIM